MDSKHIPVVIGTARLERRTAAIAKAVVDVINQTPGHHATLVDVKDHVRDAVTVPPWGTGGANEQPTKWKEIVSSAHALVLVVPEYNHSFPGELKLLLDSLWEDYNGKAVGLVGVSAGTLGAARVVDHIKPVLIELKLHPIKEAVHISEAEQALETDGSFRDETTTSYVSKMVHEISRLSDALQTLD
jgi:Predicted flavoprotein